MSLVFMIETCYEHLKLGNFNDICISEVDTIRHYTINGGQPYSFSEVGNIVIEIETWYGIYDSIDITYNELRFTLDTENIILVDALDMTEEYYFQINVLYDLKNITFEHMKLLTEISLSLSHYQKE